MNALRIPRIMLAGTARGVGVSLIGVGIVTALRRRGLAATAVVVGPNMSQAAIYRRLTSSLINTLDQRILNKHQIMNSLYLSGLGADLILIEGADGLFDSTEFTPLNGSSAEIAALTRSPAVLVFDAGGWQTSVVALLKGFYETARGFKLSGAIANKVGTEFDFDKHVKVLEDSIIVAGQPPLLGNFPRVTEMSFSPLRQVTEKINSSLIPSGFPEKLAALAEKHLDLDNIVRIAGEIELIPLEKSLDSLSRRARIAYPSDSAFVMGFQDNLNWLRFYGAELVPFSPMADIELPKNIGALYLCGGAFADYAKNLVDNQSLRRSILNFYKQGGPIYSEGGGTAYLCDSFEFSDAGQSFNGVGVIKGHACMENTECKYIEAVSFEDSVVGWPGIILKGITTGEWRLRSDEKLLKLFRVTAEGGDTFLEGFSPGAQVLSSFCFFHWGSNNLIAKNFVDAAQAFQNSTKG